MKLVHIFKDYYLGISFMGIIAFVIQEIPYLIMPIINPKSNPIMNMQNEIQWLDRIQGVFGVLSMVLLILIVKKEESFFHIGTGKEKIFFFLTVGMILINFIGWTLYYLGCQYSLLIVVSQFAVVPLYYLFFGLWKSNYLLVGSASIFFVIHTVNGCLNFYAKNLLNF